MRRGVIAVWLVGCNFHHGAVTVDTSAFASDGNGTCFTSSVGAFCIPQPTMMTALPDATIDTGSSALCEPYTSVPAGISASVISGTTITDANNFHAIGANPLVLISTGDVVIASGLDVASHGATVGAGGDDPSCTQGVPPGSATVSAGGAGGSVGGTGGNGGNGGNGSTGAIGGVPAPATGKPNRIHGGCPGGAGADAVNGGAAGHGGGGVIVIARASIAVEGSLDASGSSGGGAQSKQGGGGGGSGGLIVLDAPTVAVTGSVWANGGGGGEGAGGHTGNPGSESTAPATAGAGGDGGSTAGGDGGAGSSAGTLDGSPGITGTGAGAGGGGGGGAGVIDAASKSGTGSTINVAPPPS